MRKIALLIVFFSCVTIFAQNTIVEKDFMVFKPTESSIKLNKVYTENMFFGLFGVKNLVNALPIDESKIKTVVITNVATKKVVYKANYDLNNHIIDLELTNELIDPTKVNYSYKDGVLEKEMITKKGKEQRVNEFFYDQDKMYIKNANKLFDIVWLEGDILLKKTYLDQKLGFEDRLMHDCRITKSLGRDINKVCFSSSIFKAPFKVKEYTPEIEPKTEKVNLIDGPWSEIKLIKDNKYQILKNNQPQFEVVLDQNKRIKEFKFLGNKSEKQEPMNFKFTYTFYK
ncbi:hypothetical protein [Chishuiella sp.]|uniref:hypothetical protein n=1 Tax=Chishuiella sp. TaxID=1969467 RepID=UPI0028A6A541|nr:hypothetical protein [Chishuiella sp.]